ncbi:MAG TPA: hypothetical protein VGA99_14425, partial [bacterium]
MCHFILHFSASLFFNQVAPFSKRSFELHLYIRAIPYYKFAKHCFFSKVFNEPQRHKEHKDFLSGFFAFLSVLCVFVVEYFGCLPVADRPAMLRW